MDKDPDVDIIELADTIKEEPKLEKSDFDKRHDDEPRFFNRKKKTLLKRLGLSVHACNIISRFLPPYLRFTELLKPMSQADSLSGKLGGLLCFTPS